MTRQNSDLHSPDYPSSEISDEALLAKYEKLIIFEARKIARTYDLGPDQEDIAQIARMKLCGVAQDVRTAEPYCRTVIYNACRDAIKVLKRQTDGLLSIEDEDEPAAAWTITDDALPPSPIKPILETLQDQDLYDRLTATLSAEQTLVVGIWYGLDNGDPVTSARSVSRRTGIKEARVTEILRAALAKLRSAAASITQTAS